MREHPTVQFTLLMAGLMLWVAGAGALGQGLGAEGAGLAAAMGECGVTWTVRNPGTTHWLRAVTWTGTQLVAVGDVGTILTSPDGVTWTSRTSGASEQLQGVAWTGSRLVAVGWGGPIVTSSDGVAWTNASPGNTYSLTAVSWTGSQLVAVGGSGLIVTSPDGSAWTTHASGISKNLSAVTWTGSKLVAVGEDGTILTSPDAATWTAETAGVSGFLYGVTWTGSQLVGVGESGTIVTSPDGITWTARTSGTSVGLYGVIWTGSQFVAVGDSSTILTSPDGVTWTSRQSGIGGYVFAVVSTGAQLVGVGGAGSGGTVLTSPCGTTAYPYSAWVPVVSHVDGLKNSRWRSDLGLLNTGNVAANVELDLFTGGSPITVTTQVAAGAQSILVDVVGQLGVGGSGPLQVLSDRPLKVTSRTYTQVLSTANCYPNGTQGQNYPAIVAGNGLSAGQVAYLAGLTENAASYRCNIGLVNVGTGAATVLVELLDGAGSKLTDYTVSLGPGQWAQETQPFYSKAGQTAMERGYARITVQSGSGVFGFASVIDNITNDPTAVTMLP